MGSGVEVGSEQEAKVQAAIMFDWSARAHTSVSWCRRSEAVRREAPDVPLLQSHWLRLPPDRKCSAVHRNRLWCGRERTYGGVVDTGIPIGHDVRHRESLTHPTTPDRRHDRGADGHNRMDMR
jgi:hypothetical protein